MKASSIFSPNLLQSGNEWLFIPFWATAVCSMSAQCFHWVHCQDTLERRGCIQHSCKMGSQRLTALSNFPKVTQQKEGSRVLSNPRLWFYLQAFVFWGFPPLNWYFPNWETHIPCVNKLVLDVCGQGRKQHWIKWWESCFIFNVFSYILASQVENGFGINVVLVHVQYLLISLFNKGSWCQA